MVGQAQSTGDVKGTGVGAPGAPAPGAIDALHVAPLRHEEASVLAAAVLDRFVAVLEGLSEEEWLAPTYCSEWRVREVVSHEAGGFESGLSFGNFRRSWVRIPPRGRALMDVVNAEQVSARAARTPAELLAEVRDVGPRAIAARRGLAGWVRALPIPLPPLGLRSAGYLTDDIYLRDNWIHTVDICHAAGRPLPIDAALDSRMVALLLRDLSARLTPALGTRAVVLNLTGAAGGAFRFGAQTAPSAVIEIDAIDFCLRTSERTTLEQALAQSRIVGDEALAAFLLKNSFILY